MRSFVFGFCFFALSLTVSSIVSAETLTEKIATAFDTGDFPGLHSSLLIKNNEVLAENYFVGEDENWGRKLGVREFTEHSLHDLRSVTKSIVGLLYAIALDEEKVPGLDDSLMDSFPEYKKYASSKRKRIKIEDVLSMRMGINWNEKIPYTDKKNSEIAMEYAKDRYQFILSRKVQRKPGKKWNYNGGATALLAKLIEKGTGQSVDDYARAKLFGPLGIKNVEWNRSWDNLPSAASGLRMTMRDLAKIGQLIVDRGEHDGKRVVSEERLQLFLEPRVKAGLLRFGYHWWLSPTGNPPPAVFALGNGGQRLSVNQSEGIVTVIFAGNYNHADYWSMPIKLVNEYFLPALVR
jgi:CubicO group peptidase (beta-lactamase class C family)